MSGGPPKGFGENELWEVQGFLAQQDGEKRSALSLHGAALGSCQKHRLCLPSCHPPCSTAWRFSLAEVRVWGSPTTLLCLTPGCRFTVPCCCLDPNPSPFPAGSQPSASSMTSPPLPLPHGPSSPHPRLGFLSTVLLSLWSLSCSPLFTSPPSHTRPPSTPSPAACDRPWWTVHESLKANPPVPAESP